MRTKRTHSPSLFPGIQRSAAVGAGVLTMALGLLCSRSVEAASLQPVNDWGASGVPSYISMFIYVPDKPATNPPILVLSHYCGGNAAGVFGQARGAGIVAAADQYGFIMIVPQTTNPASSSNCWDVGSKQSLTRDGGGDTQAIVQMVKYTVANHGANADRVYATGDSSGAMLTQALLAVYPDVFKAGASFAGVPAGCWSAGWSAASNWGGTCASGKDILAAQQWGDLVRGMNVGYTGHRPRVQLFHGDADKTISYENFGEGIKEWTNVLGLDTNPTSTTTGLTLGTHPATRQQWKNACGVVVLDAFTSIGGDHGPSDALFDAAYVVPFLGLDTIGPIDPELAACPDGGSGGASEGTGTAVTADAGAASGDGSTPPTYAVGTTGTDTTGGVDATGPSMTGAVGVTSTAGSLATGGSEDSSLPGTSPTGGGNSLSGSGISPADHSGCTLSNTRSRSPAALNAVVLLGLAFSAFGRRRWPTSKR